MATKRYSINPEDKQQDVTEAAGAAVATKKIELTVDWDTLAALTPNMTGAHARLQVLAALEKLASYIEQSGKFNQPS